MIHDLSEIWRIAVIIKPGLRAEFGRKITDRFNVISRFGIFTSVRDGYHFPAQKMDLVECRHDLWLFLGLGIIGVGQQCLLNLHEAAWCVPAPLIIDNLQVNDFSHISNLFPQFKHRYAG